MSISSVIGFCFITFFISMIATCLIIDFIQKENKQKFEKLQKRIDNLEDLTDEFVLHYNEHLSTKH